MSADTLVYDMASAPDSTSSVFVNKSWLSILDNQNGSYTGLQSIIDTSQLSNSNRYMNYREAYLTVPLIITATSNTSPASGDFAPATAGTSADYLFGLKNWYGSLIHSITCEMNGSVVIQQTPYCGLWNSFKLLTSLSQEDIRTQGATIGFFPDNPQSFIFTSANDTTGISGTTTNNIIAGVFPVTAGALNSYDGSNEGLMRRTQYWNFDPDGSTGIANSVAFSSLVSTSNLNLLWKSYIYTKQNSTASLQGVWQCAITGVIKLKHLHSFFEKLPLLKGVFFKITLNLNLTSVSITAGASNVVTACSVTSPLGGVSPLMVSQLNNSVVASGKSLLISLSVGNRVLNTSQSGVSGVANSPLGSSVLLNVPAYTFSPIFETAYLASPIKKISYTDIYQYAILNTASGAQINSLVTNGISDLRSVLCIPFYTATANGTLLPIQSPFTGEGAGLTSPLCHLTQFNIQVSGQNAIYNQQKYTYEAFVNQLAGVNSVNGGQTDGMCSGLIGQLDFENQYCYYYVNVGRMLEVEKAVPKSVSVLGTNTSAKAIDLYVFCEYGASISVDCLTGSRVG